MLKLSKRWLWLVGALAAIALLAAACGEEEEEQPTPTPAAGETPAVEETPAAELKTDFGVTDTQIILGQHTVLSGNLAAVYSPIPPAIQAYFSYINDVEGGVCERELVLKVEDDQYSPALALDAAKKLVEQDRIVAFVGNLGTPPNTGSVDYINEQEVPDLLLSTGASKWGDYERWPWTTSFIPDYRTEGKILATYVNDNFPGQSVAILFQNDDFGKDGRDGFVEVFAGEIVAEQTYESTATDITSQLANLRDADPDILYLYATPAFVAKVFTYMEQNNWTPQVVQSYVNAADTLAKLVGGEAGVEAGFEKIAGTISTNYLLDPVADADNPAMQKHAQIMEDYDGPPVSNLSVYGQALAETAVEILKIACDNGDMTRAGVMRAAESLQGFSPSVIFPGIEITLGPTDHRAIEELMPVEIQPDGTLKPLAPEPISAG